MSPLKRSLPISQPVAASTENLHRFQTIEAALRQQRGHVVHPGEAAARSVRQKRLGVEAGLVFDEQLELLVLDRLRYVESPTPNDTIKLAIRGIARLEVVPERRIFAVVVLNHICIAGKSNYPLRVST